MKKHDFTDEHALLASPRGSSCCIAKRDSCDNRRRHLPEIVAPPAADALDSFRSRSTASRGRLLMQKLLGLGLLALLACGSAYAADDTKAMNSQQNKMKTCQAQAGEKKLEGKARQDYVNNCLKAKPSKAADSKSKMAECNAKTKGLSKEEANKVRSECMKAG
jgi:hypothetical protein